jgi:hypothetical protein
MSLIKIDPAYLRFIYDGLSDGSINKNDLSNLPKGIEGIYDRIFDLNNSAIQRQSDLKIFTFFALLSKPVQLTYFTSISEIDENYIREFISKYSKFFSYNIDGSISLYHEKFIIYILCRSSTKELFECNKIILNSLKKLENNNWLIQQIGKHYALADEYDNLFLHLYNNISYNQSDWWNRDMNYFLDYLKEHDNSFSHYNLLCDILRLTINQYLSKKGAYIIVQNAEKIDWQQLNDFINTSRFEFELAIEFSKNIDKIPQNWIQILIDELHPCSYLFSYVWKYINYDSKNNIDLGYINKLWFEGSAYTRIIIIMVWGYRSLNFNEQDWFSTLWNSDKQWPYLRIEYEDWLISIQDKRDNSYVNEFEKIKTNLPEKYHYIFDHYWNLFDYIDQLDQDIEELFILEQVFDLAYWIYKNPVWEVSNLANKLILSRIKIKYFRKTTIEWIKNKLVYENFYSLAQLIFQIKSFISSDEEFFELCVLAAKSNNCHLRGSFIVDLSLYFETSNNEKLLIFTKDNLLPILFQNSDDIWETQEILRLLIVVNKYLNLPSSYFKVFFDNHFLLSKIENPMDISESELYEKCSEFFMNHS